MKRLDLASSTFGRLTVLEYGRRGWRCLCACGKETTVPSSNLTMGHTKSCGCLKWEKRFELGALTRVHGMRRTPEYKSWVGLRDRCQRHPSYKGREIRVCTRWESFENFYADMGARPSLAYSIDRINNDGDYGPDNCRWATRSEQARNRCKTQRHSEATRHKISLIVKDYWRRRRAK